ncbi:MAG TPA: hypothetical protein VJS88_06100 [Chthoniobacterales bacterium]|nr:hypothetical protein [Chthoniobacterales bacterium]
MKIRNLRLSTVIALVVVNVAAFVVGLSASMPAIFGVTPQLCALNPASALKLDVIMRNGLRALERYLSPVLALSTVFRDQVLTESDTIQVPFYPLETLTSKDFDGSYDFESADGNVNSRPVVVDKRKYQPLEFTSKELRRNSTVDLGMILMLKIEKLAEDVLNDIFSVVTAANYTTSTTIGAASAFDRYDLADLKGKCTKTLQWPTSGRSLILETDYTTALVKDIMAVNTSGGDEMRREGSIGRAGGFDIFEHPGMPTNSENLIGLALLRYAILVAFAPIEPADEVRANMSDYRKYTGKQGLTLEYRSWGDPNSDSAKRTIEVSYGKAKGDGDQALRLTSA